MKIVCGRTRGHNVFPQNTRYTSFTLIFIHDLKMTRLVFAGTAASSILQKSQASVLCGFRIPFQLVYEGV